MSNWVALGPLPNSNVAHTAPIDDGIEHDVSDDCECICGPNLEHLLRDDEVTHGCTYITASTDASGTNDRRYWTPTFRRTATRAA